MEMELIGGIKVKKIREMTKDVGGKIPILLHRHLAHQASCGIGFTVFSIYDWHIYSIMINHLQYFGLYMHKKAFLYIQRSIAHIYDTRGGIRCADAPSCAKILDFLVPFTQRYAAKGKKVKKL